MACYSTKLYSCSPSPTPLSRRATLSTLPTAKPRRVSHGLVAVAENPTAPLHRLPRSCSARAFTPSPGRPEHVPVGNMRSREKLVLVAAHLGVYLIDAGFQASSPDDLDAMRFITMEVGNTPVGEDGYVLAIFSFSGCNKRDTETKAARDKENPPIPVSFATSKILKLPMKPEQVVDIAKEVTAYARSLGFPHVGFSPEDAGRLNQEFMIHILVEGIKAGATTLSIQGTGYTPHHELEELIADIKANSTGTENTIISTHCLNDLGLATKTSVGVSAGALQLEVTINGSNESAGNASLEKVPVETKCRQDLLGDLYTRDGTQESAVTSKMVQEQSGLHAQPHKATVGANAIAHESEIHQDLNGMGELKGTSGITSTGDICLTHGNDFDIGKLSGSHAIGTELVEVGYDKEIKDSFKRVNEDAEEKKPWLDSLLETMIKIYRHLKVARGVCRAIMSIRQQLPDCLPFMWQIAQPCLRVITFSVLGAMLTLGFAAMCYGMVVVLKAKSKSHSA